MTLDIMQPEDDPVMKTFLGLALKVVVAQRTMVAKPVESPPPSRVREAGEATSQQLLSFMEDG